MPRPYSFFRTISCSTCRFSDRSATSRLSLPFSSRDWRSSRSSLSASPAYFFFQTKNIASLIPCSQQISATFSPLPPDAAPAGSSPRCVPCSAPSWLPFWLSRRPPPPLHSQLTAVLLFGFWVTEAYESGLDAI